MSVIQFSSPVICPVPQTAPLRLFFVEINVKSHSHIFNNKKFERNKNKTIEEIHIHHD
jgi:hypothetical protein